MFFWTDKTLERGSVKDHSFAEDYLNITTDEVATILGISKRAVLKQLANMKNRIVHTGPSHGGHWEIIEDKME